MTNTTRKVKQGDEEEIKKYLSGKVTLALYDKGLSKCKSVDNVLSRRKHKSKVLRNGLGYCSKNKGNQVWLEVKLQKGEYKEKRSEKQKEDRWCRQK